MEGVVLFDALSGRMDKAGICTEAEDQLARAAYLQTTRSGEILERISQHTLVLGTKSIGELVLCGSQTPLVANALGSLTAIAWNDTIRSKRRALPLQHIKAKACAQRCWTR